jgi:hypothetical protein
MELLIINRDTTIAEIGRPAMKEIEAVAREIVDADFEGQQIDWRHVWAELDSRTVVGRVLDLQAEDSPVQKLVRTLIEEGL